MRHNVELAGRTRRGVAFATAGDGPPLVLLHGLGSAHSAWLPVLDRLAASHTVYAVDLPGFGASERLDGSAAATPRRFAEAVSAALDEWGLDTPHVAGHSLGAWIALELAGIRPVASLTLLAPPGLWRKHQPLYCAVSLRLTRAACRYTPWLVTSLSRWAVGRRLLFWQLFAHPERLSPADVRRDAALMGRGPGFLPAFRATRRLRYTASREVLAPVTLAFGACDRLLLPRQSRHTDQLPRHTRHVVLPDSGHVPMSDAPELVAQVVLATTGAAA
ncbi:alpha/beta fold hydrolase [Actinophytocola sp.]|uniref:alpha/beta fold hydrolase n=1 Tax=Actinophytocola sp. TaxID=1872138 RepID=UPI002D7E4E31|nr:alpha/beta fold hydrolase [Actinophytocola sp.]HET9137784.1 alpha/beta fold hydrolase [Actinophytocola sp.]HEU5108899.1 alpha/beta fold hydrolase [Micromonosporaceae bacterium]